MITARITLNGEKYAVRASTAAAVYYEQVTGKGFDLDTLTDQMLYCWCMVIAANPDKPMLDFRTFLDALDASPDAADGFAALLDDLRRRSQAAQAVTGREDGDGSKKN